MSSLGADMGHSSAQPVRDVQLVSGVQPVSDVQPVSAVRPVSVVHSREQSDGEDSVVETEDGPVYDGTAETKVNFRLFLGLGRVHDYPAYGLIKTYNRL